ncbi:MAG: hypothetical protein Q9224_006481, partial [Gallowayella concinna]
RNLALHDKTNVARQEIKVATGRYLERKKMMQSLKDCLETMERTRQIITVDVRNEMHKRQDGRTLKEKLQEFQGGLPNEDNYDKVDLPGFDMIHPDTIDSDSDILIDDEQMEDQKTTVSTGSSGSL